MTGPGSDGGPVTEHLGEAISALADGQLAGTEAATARAHLAGCEPCAAELVATEAMRALVRALPMVEPLRPLLAVPSAPRPSRLPHRTRPGRLGGALAAAAASVAMLLLSGVHPDSGTGPQVAQLVQVHTTSPVNADLMSQVAPAALPVSFQR